MSFDSLAPVYRAMEFIAAGPMLQQCRTAFLPETRNCRRALLLGEGPGRFLMELVRQNPTMEVTCIERSPRMLREARSSLQRTGLNGSRVTFIEGDALTWSPPVDRFDLIATHFFLDCFRPDELRDLVPRVGSSAAPGALWLIGDFCLPDHGWQRQRARAVHALMYAFFRRTTGLSARRWTPPDADLASAGFMRIGRRHFNLGLLQSDLWSKGPR